MVVFHYGSMLSYLVAYSVLGLDMIYEFLVVTINVTTLVGDFYMVDQVC